MVHISVAAAWRDEQAAFRVLFLQDTHFLAVSTARFSEFLPNLQTNFTPLLIATLWVARLTLQTRKLWLVGVATDREARYLGLARMQGTFAKVKKVEK